MSYVLNPVDFELCEDIVQMNEDETSSSIRKQTAKHKRKSCGIEGCVKWARGGGFCTKHGGGKRCGVQSCNKHVVRRGFCTQHGAL